MACRLLGINPLSEQKSAICQLDLLEHISLKFETNYNISMHEKIFEHIADKITTILSQPK